MPQATDGSDEQAETHQVQELKDLEEQVVASSAHVKVLKDREKTDQI